jgi:hypothetical protein
MSPRQNTHLRLGSAPALMHKRRRGTCMSEGPCVGKARFTLSSPHGKASPGKGGTQILQRGAREPRGRATAAPPPPPHSFHTCSILLKEEEGRLRMRWGGERGRSGPRAKSKRAKRGASTKYRYRRGGGEGRGTGAYPHLLTKRHVSRRCSGRAGGGAGGGINDGFGPSHG